MGSLLVYKKAIDLCILTLDPADSSHFCNILVIDLVFQGSKNKSINGVIFFSSFSIFMPLLSFSGLIAFNISSRAS